MTIEEFKLFEEKLATHGYRKYNGKIINEDFYYCKGFGKGQNKHDEDRNNYQILFKVWDFSKYADRDKMCAINPMHIAPMIMVSRVIDERLDLGLHSETIEETDINQIENLAESFFVWVEQNVEV